MSQDQIFQQMYPDAALQIRKVILSQYSWLNFRKFEPREGVGGNPYQPMGIRQFANQFPQMQAAGRQMVGVGSEGQVGR